MVQNGQLKKDMVKKKIIKKQKMKDVYQKQTLIQYQTKQLREGYHN